MGRRYLHQVDRDLPQAREFIIRQRFVSRKPALLRTYRSRKASDGFSWGRWKGATPLAPSQNSQMPRVWAGARGQERCAPGGAGFWFCCRCGCETKSCISHPAGLHQHICIPGHPVCLHQHISVLFLSEPRIQMHSFSTWSNYCLWTNVRLTDRKIQTSVHLHSEKVAYKSSYIFVKAKERNAFSFLPLQTFS